MATISPRPFGLISFVRRCQLWAITNTLAAVGVCAITDGLQALDSPGVRPTQLLAIVCTTAALATLLAVVTSPLAAALFAFANFVSTRRGWVGQLWFLPFAVVAFVIGGLISDVLYRPHRAVYLAILLLFAALVALTALCARYSNRLLFVVLAIVIGGASLAADLMTARNYYRELHDLLALVTLCAASALLGPLRRRVGDWPRAKIMTVFLVLSLMTWGELRAVDAAAPGWRTKGWIHARFLPRLTQTTRALVDLDGDGFSPIAWGGDCDDFNPNRNPGVRDLPGDHVDANCNGVDPPVHPSDAQLGLAQPVGSPDLASNAIDRVVLITIDCARWDVMRKEVVPRLWDLSERGIRFGRMYSAGSRTIVSLPLIQTGAEGSPPLAARLAKAGVSTTAIFAVHDNQSLDKFVLSGFQDIKWPTFEVRRWDAAHVTDLAIRDLAQHASDRHYLYLHYFDAHDPYEPIPRSYSISPQSNMPATHQLYLQELAYLDEQIGRLLDQMKRDGQLDRTLFIVTADHGEGFGEHGVLRHAITGYEMLIHVPGLMTGPGFSTARYDGILSHLDVMPTVLGAFGLVATNPDAERYGRSWMRLRSAANEPLHRFVISRSAQFGRGDDVSFPMLIIVEKKFKLIETLGNQLLEMYNPLSDPDETNDVTIDHPQEAVRLHDELELYRDIRGWL